MDKMRGEHKNQDHHMALCPPTHTHRPGGSEHDRARDSFLRPTMPQQLVHRTCAAVRG